MTRLVLIQAGPTPWDEEDRLTGSQALPLTDAAQASIRQTVERLNFPISAIYRARQNEAADQTAKIVAHKSRRRPRDLKILEEMNLGLWQGLRRGELKSRFPSAFPRWQEDPLSINPPEGESLEYAIARLRAALGQLLRRHRGETIALALRPMAMQIVAGILRLESPQQIATHLHNRTPIETLDVTDEDSQKMTA